MRSKPSKKHYGYSGYPISNIQIFNLFLMYSPGLPFSFIFAHWIQKKVFQETGKDPLKIKLIS